MKYDLGHRWNVLVFRVVVLIAIFEAGWYSSAWKSALLSKGMGRDQETPTKKSAQSLAGRLAGAKADLAQILKAGDVTLRGVKTLAYIKTLDAETVKDLLNDFTTNPSAFKKNGQEFMALIGRWGELAPHAALAWAQGIHDPSMSQVGVDEIFGNWSAQDPSAAFKALSQFKDVSKIRYAADEIIQNYASQNPQATLAAVGTLPAGQSSELYPTLFRIWASQDPSAAAASALQLPPSSDRYMAQYAIAGAWAEQDPAAALAWAKTLPSGQVQNGVVTSVLQAMSQNDPAATAELATSLNLLAGPLRDSLFDNINHYWAQADPTGLLTWADQNLTGTAFDSAAQAALNQMSTFDPAAAAAYIENSTDSNVNSKVIPALATTWARQDPQSALAWAQSLSTDNAALRQTAISDVFNAWITADPAASATYIQQNLATDPSFNKLATQVVNSWANADPQAALTWSENLPAGNAQDSAVNAAITQLAKFDPQTAWNDALQLSGSSQNAAVVNVISQLANQQPDQAAALLANLPQGADLVAATGDVAKSWLSQDPNAASQWINTLPQGSSRDAAINQIIAAVGKNDPAAAFNWAITISDETTRNSQVVKLAGQWSNINPAAAATAAQNAMGNLNGLTPAQQTALQNVEYEATAR